MADKNIQYEIYIRYHKKYVYCIFILFTDHKAEYSIQV